MPRYNIEDWASRIIEACENSLSMAEASSKLPMNFKTFKKLAVKLGVYAPNQPGKGKTKNKSATAFKTQDILDGKHPGYKTHRLRERLLSENWKKHECENCKNSEWLGSPIPLELHHIDGNNSNNFLENLQLLCPNCHALTENYRGRKNKNKTE